MNNEAISVVLDHICNQARNSVHATYGALELLRRREAVTVLAGSPPRIETASGDRLLRFIDDVRELLPAAPPAPLRLEDFDLVPCVSGIVDALNLASRRRARRMELDTPPDSLIVTQDRGGVEDVLTRTLKASLHLTRTSEVQVRLSANRESCGAWAVIAGRDKDLATKLLHWLTADPAKVSFPDHDEVAVGIAMLVAGRHLRGLGGSAELERDAAGHSSVAIHVPSRQRQDADESARHEPDALSVLVVEDCDESFVLSEVALEKECVSRAHDAREAIEKIHRRRFDLVLMDIHMPGMTGYEAIRNIRDWETGTGNARTPVVVLSSDDLETQRRCAAQCGCSGFLRKPLHRAELVDLLDRLKHSRVLA